MTQKTVKGQLRQMLKSLCNCPHRRGSVTMKGILIRSALLWSDEPRNTYSNLLWASVAEDAGAHNIPALNVAVQCDPPPTEPWAVTAAPGCTDRQPLISNWAFLRTSQGHFTVALLNWCYKSLHGDRPMFYDTTELMLPYCCKSTNLIIRDRGLHTTHFAQQNFWLWNPNPNCQ